MATTVGQHSVAAFTSPVNGTTPIDANTVRGNDNTVRVAYVDHDADPGIHVQSSTLASRPVAGTAGRKWITEDSGVYTLWFDDGTNWHPVSSENVALSVLAGETLAKGDVVKVTGWNNGQDLPEVAKVASASDTAFAVMTAAVASGAMGYATNTGIVQDVNTGSFSVGNILYPNTSGGFTATKPTSGNYQPVAFVLRSNSNNGVIFVEFSAPRIVERSDNTASTIVLRDASGNFSAGTITAGALTSTGLVTFASLKGTGATTVTNILDEDNMASDSATALATQQSIKAYVDAKVATVDTLAEVLANGNTTGANDIIVNAGQKIRTPLIASQNNATAITIADTTGALTLASALADSNLATISTAGKVSNSATTATSANTVSAIVARDSSGNFSAGTITANLTGNISGTAPAGTLTGTTLASNVVSSSLTSLGTLTSLTVNGDITASTNQLKLAASTGNLGIGTATPAYKLDVVGSANVSTGNTYKVNGTDVLSATTLGSGVTASSLTSVGTLTSLTVSGAITGATSTNTINGLVINSGGLGGATGIKFGIGAAFSSGQAEAYTTSTTPMGIGTVGAQPLRFYTNSALVAAFDSSGNLAVDTNTLYVDAANNRVGIGTASPGQTLDVSSTSTNVARFATTAAASFSIMQLSGNSSGGSLEFRNGATGLSAVVGTTTGTGDLKFYTNAFNTLAATIDSAGNLGLGVTPSAWGSTNRALEIGSLGHGMFRRSTAEFYMVQNTYWDGTNFKYAATTGVPSSYYAQNDGKHIWAYAASGTVGNTATFTQAMTLDASGNLGLGTTSPAGAFEIVRNSSSGSGTAYPNIRLDNQNASGYTGLYFLNSGTSKAFFELKNDVGALTMGTGTTERARITSGGYFKASNTGTYNEATGSYHEFISDVNSILMARFENTNNTSGVGVMASFLGSNCSNTSSYHLICGTGGADKLYIYGNGNVVNTGNSYGTLSDVKLKQDIVDATSQWDDVKAIRFRKYRLKADVEAMGDAAPVMLGVVAQELQAVSPGLIDSTPDREQVEVTDEDGKVTTEMRPTGTETLSVKSSILLMKAAVALQEAMARIEALEVEVAALKANA